jgi:mRNA-degrading endonuclease RelE of RelBE toxin-antitoxin system
VPWRVELSEDADTDLARLRTFDHRRILGAIRQQLTAEPNVETRNRKCLGDNETADFEYVPPLWELRVGEFRVFYELEPGERRVYIHAVRGKPPGSTTSEVLNEDR